MIYFLFYLLMLGQIIQGKIFYSKVKKISSIFFGKTLYFMHCEKQNENRNSFDVITQFQFDF